MKIKLKNITNIIMGVPENRNEDSFLYEYRCIHPSSLQLNNKLGRIPVDFRDDPVDDKIYIRKGDILIKRINPSYVNVISDSTPSTITTRNILIVRPHTEQCSAYLAAMIEIEGLMKHNIYAKSGTALRALSKKQLEDMEVPLINIESQIAIGKMWLLSKQKAELYSHAINEEQNRIKALVQKIASEEE